MRACFPLAISLFFAHLPSLVGAQTIDERAQRLLDQMTLEQKIRQLHHNGIFSTADVKSNTFVGVKRNNGKHASILTFMHISLKIEPSTIST